MKRFFILKNPIKNLYEDGLYRMTQTLDHVVLVYILISDKRKFQINEYSDYYMCAIKHVVYNISVRSKIHKFNYYVVGMLSLEEILSIPTMLSMTHCPKQLIKWLWRLPNSPCVTWPTCESLLSHLNDLWWTLLKTIQYTYIMSTMYHPLHPFVYDMDRISRLG